MPDSSTYAAVCGALNMDFNARSCSELIARDSNPGAMRVSFGGVGGNIARNLSLLGVPVKFLTAFGEDINAAAVGNCCISSGLDLSLAVTVPGGRTSTYLAISGPDGDMALAVSDMELLESITPAVVERALPVLNGAKIVAFDANLPVETIDFLTACCTAPLLCDPVSVTKAMKLKPFLNRLFALKPNALEAAALTGYENPADSAKALCDMGVEHAFVSWGLRGLYTHSRTGVSFHAPCPAATPVNATGAGDALTAALCKAYFEGYSVKEAAMYAVAAGVVAIEGEDTVNEEMCDERVREKMGTSGTGCEFIQ